LNIAYQLLGGALLRGGKPAEALSAFKTAQAMSEDAVRAAPQDSQNRRYIAYSLENIGEILAHMGNRAAGVDSLRRALQIREEYAKASPSDLEGMEDVAVAARKAAAVEAQLSHFHEAHTLYRRAQDVAEQIHRANPAFRGIPEGIGDPGALAQEIAAADAAIARLAR
jgi:tetratricopeptide (TPR) repeat protein